MLKPLLAVILLSGYIATARAQSLPMPNDIQRAFNKGTRSLDGFPGKSYWQNHGKYTIEITALPPDRNIKGTEQITYINNSPDVLTSLNMKLILNIHRPDAPRFSDADADYFTRGMLIDQFTANGKPVKFNNDAATTNQMIKLPNALMPHDSVKLNIKWHYQISLKSDREGMIDSTTYYLAYFYPRVAVYDDYNGWDKIEFIDRQEFYNDFNDYTLKVTVPKNYLVWATGTLQNTAEVLQPEFAKRLQASFTSDSTLHVATLDDVTGNKVTQQNATNTWVWKANDITDVALGLSNHYVWDAASVVVDDATHRRASMQAAYLNGEQSFRHSVQYGRNSLGWLSHNWPGVPYPFPKMTAFQGFADMEYPMMVNDNKDSVLHFFQFVQDHEIAHTYFPFYMGTNESHYAFMDEGWATTFELLIGSAEVGKEAAEKQYKDFRVKRWVEKVPDADDVPVITPSDGQRASYSANSYVKPSLSYLALKDMLGDELFKKSLHAYMDRWHSKHPIPWDYFNTMTNASGKKLDWFFNNWFFGNYYIDIKVSSVTKAADSYQIRINNIGGYAIPFDVVATYTDGTTGIFHQTPIVWEDNQKNTVIQIKGDKIIRMLKLDGGIFVNADEKDTVWKGK